MKIGGRISTSCSSIAQVSVSHNLIEELSITKQTKMQQRKLASRFYYIVLRMHDRDQN